MVFEVSTQIQNDFCLLQTGCPLNRYCVIVPNYSSFRREKAIKRKAPKNSVPLLAEAVGVDNTQYIAYNILKKYYILRIFVLCHILVTSGYKKSPSVG